MGRLKSAAKSTCIDFAAESRELGDESMVGPLCGTLWTAEGSDWEQDKQLVRVVWKFGVEILKINIQISTAVHALRIGIGAFTIGDCHYPCRLTFILLRCAVRGSGDNRHIARAGKRITRSMSMSRSRSTSAGAGAAYPSRGRSSITLRCNPSSSAEISMTSASPQRLSQNIYPNLSTNWQCLGQIRDPAD